MLVDNLQLLRKYLMIRTMLDPRDLNGVSFLTTKNVPISKNICYNITALWDILNQKCVKKNNANFRLY